MYNFATHIQLQNKTPGHIRMLGRCHIVRRGLLDQNLLAIVDIETLGCGLGVEATAIKRVVGIIHLTSYLFHLADTRLLVAEVEFEGLDGGSG